MKYYLQTINTIDSPQTLVWEKISKGDKVEEWHPLVNASHVKGNTRTCITEQGPLIEEILVLDHQHFTYKYRILEQQVYPTNSEIICTIKVLKGRSGTLFIWDIEFDLEDDLKFNEMKEGLEILAKSAARSLSEL